MNAMICMLAFASERNVRLVHSRIRQSNEYVEARMRALGYSRVPSAEHELRRRATFKWFKKTIMVFMRVHEDGMKYGEDAPKEMWIDS
jgi:hypothetical protein